MRKPYRDSQRMVVRRLGGAGLWAALLLWAFSDVQAVPTYLDTFNTRYMTAVRRLTLNDTCAVCHIAPQGAGPRTPYGEAFRLQPHSITSPAQNDQALATIEPLDSDSDGVSNIDEIRALAFPGDANDIPPIADAGAPQTVPEGALVTLNGLNSRDRDRQQGPLTVTFLWSQTSGPQVTLSNERAAQPTFTAPSVGPSGATLEFEVLFTDDEGSFATQRVLITVSDVNQPPMVVTSPPQTVSEGALVTLDGSQSRDPEDTTLTFAWLQVAGPPVILSNPLTARPTFIAPSVGGMTVVLTFELRVTDADGLSAVGSAFVNVSTTNLPPIADAGLSQSVFEGELVTLDGSQSRDPEGTLVTFAWRQVAGPPVTLSNPLSARPLFSAPAVDPAGAILQFEVQVTDAQGLVAIATAVVEVRNDDGTRDPDADGVSDAMENGAPNNGDGNSDGIRDSRQENVASLRENISGNYLTLVAPAGTRLVDVRMVDNPSPGDVPRGATFPLGFLSFMVQGVTPGAAITLTLLTPTGVQFNTYLKYGRTPALPFNQWYGFRFDNTTGAEVDTNRVVLHFVDGQRGDDDLAANGTILDVGGVAVQPPALSDSEGGDTLSGGSGGCAMHPGAPADVTLLGSAALILVCLVWRRLMRRRGVRCRL